MKGTRDGLIVSVAAAAAADAVVVAFCAVVTVFCADREPAAKRLAAANRHGRLNRALIK
jgi:hypothetical protein